ncbi:MAG: restriction endonuclease subunit S [Bacteroidales bacterium]|nr:restriction endonuclease subunit S [Bacteroidales bacterium]
MNNWKKTTLGEIGKIITGKTPQTAFSDNYGDYICFLTPSDNMNVKFCTNTNRMLSKKGLEEVKNNLLPANSICVSCIGSDLGKVTITSKETVTNQQINSIIVNDNYNVDFVYYAMLILGKKMNFISKTSTAVPIINKSTFSTYTINIPIDIDEQKRIADVLSALDDKIEVNNKINENLEAQAQAIFKQWFVDEVDKNWKEIELGNVIETKSGGTPSRNNKLYYINGTIDWVKSKELNASFIIDTEEKITNEALKKSSAKLLPKHSILIAMYGATVGEFAIIHKEMTCNQAICALIPNNQYPYSYLYMLIKNKKTELINMAVGSAQQNISQQLIKKILVLDCVDKIKEYHQLVKPMFENIINNKIENQNLSEIRDSLLPKLMSGEIRV